MTEVFHILMWALATRSHITVKTYRTVHLRLVAFFYMKFIPNVCSFFLFKIYSSIYFWRHWALVAACRLPLGAAIGLLSSCAALALTVLASLVVERGP